MRATVSTIKQSRGVQIKYRKHKANFKQEEAQKKSSWSLTTACTQQI